MSVTSHTHTSYTYLNESIPYLANGFTSPVKIRSKPKEVHIEENIYKKCVPFQFLSGRYEYYCLKTGRTDEWCSLFSVISSVLTSTSTIV